MLTDENDSNFRGLERNLTNRVSREIDSVVERAEDRSQNTLLVAVKNFITLTVGLPVTSANASSGLEADCVVAGSEREKLAGIPTIFSCTNTSSRTNTFHDTILNDEIRKYNPDKVDEL